MVNRINTDRVIVSPRSHIIEAPPSISGCIRRFDNHNVHPQTPGVGSPRYHRGLSCHRHQRQSKAACLPSSPLPDLPRANPSQLCRTPDIHYSTQRSEQHSHQHQIMLSHRRQKACFAHRQRLAARQTPTFNGRVCLRTPSSNSSRSRLRG